MKTTAVSGTPLTVATHRDTGCHHQPACPGADAPDRDAAHTLVYYPEQGWSLLCNGIVLFEDTGELLPDGKIVAPHRAPACPAA